MNSFYLEILTPERVFYRGECLSLMLPITDGMLGIMANREPITASVTEGEAHYTEPSGNTVYFSVMGGMVDMQDNVVKLLCDSALLPDEIDVEKERREAEQLRSQLAKEQSERDYKLSKLMLSNAINNIKIKQKKTIN